MTEFLPVSSTGHLILTASLLQLPQTQALKSFEIAIQLGAVLAAVALYGKTLLTDRRTLLLVGCAFLPTAAIGFVLHGIIKRVLLGSVEVVLWSMFLGGIAILIFERWKPVGRTQTSLQDISVRQAVAVGCAQAVALVPGVSRSAATIICGETLGISRAAIVEFSFLLAIPTMAAATGYDLLTSASALSAADARALAVGFVLSFLVAIVAIRWFLAYVKTHSFAIFGVYRIAFAIFFWLFLLRA